MAVIIEDTRQHVGKYDEAHAYFELNDVSLIRSKMAVGDYSAAPSRVVDTKKGFEEVVGNFCSKDRDRVKREIMLAKHMGTELIFLIIDDKATSIEDAKTWKNKRGKVSGDTLYKTLDTFSKRYGVRFEFCTPADSGKRILELLEVSADAHNETASGSD